MYPGSIPLDTDLLNTNRNTAAMFGGLAAAILGTNTVVDGLACLPTSPASMNVNVTGGTIYALSTLDANPYGTLPADAVTPLVKCGQNLATTPFTVTAPVTSGYQINYLIEAAFVESDGDPLVLPYFNAANPTQPFTGPGGSQVAQNTVRTQRVGLQIKAGAPAPAGTQATPPVDNGWVGLYVISVSYGQTQVTQANISVYPGAPFIYPKLPQLGFLAGLIFSGTRGGVAMMQVWPGNPNGYVTGNAAGVATPPDVCWDSLHKLIYVCISTGNAATTVWAVQETGFSNTAVYTAGSLPYTVPQGVTKIRVRIVGGGGGGAFSTPTYTGGGGGAGGYAEAILSVSPGQIIPMIVGAGGAPGSTIGSPAGQSGQSSSFGSFVTAYGGGGGGNTLTGSGAGGQGASVAISGFSANIISAWGVVGGFGGDGGGGGLNGLSGYGGVSFFGGGGRAAAAGGNATSTQAGLALNGQAWGSGAGASYGASAGAGGFGAPGAILVDF